MSHHNKHTETACTRAHTHTCVRTRVRVYIHTYTRTYLHHCIHACVYAYTCAYTYSYVHVHTRTHIYTHTYILTRTHACVYLCSSLKVMFEDVYDNEGDWSGSVSTEVYYPPPLTPLVRPVVVERRWWSSSGDVREVKHTSDGNSCWSASTPTRAWGGLLAYTRPRSKSGMDVAILACCDASIQPTNGHAQRSHKHHTAITQRPYGDHTKTNDKILNVSKQNNDEDSSVFTLEVVWSTRRMTCTCVNH